MPIRPTFSWCRRAVGAALLALPLAAPATAAAPCTASPPATMTLFVSSGVIHDGAESRIEIRAHADGCIAVHRPRYLRDAGDYELRLGAREWATLQRAVDPAELARIDQQRLAAQTEGVWKEVPADAVIFADPDADVFTLQWRDGDRPHQLVVRNPHLAAARQPDAVELNRVATAIGALRALAVGADKRMGTEGRP